MGTIRLTSCACAIWTLLSLTGKCNTQSEGLTIPIAVILNPGDEQSKTAFRYKQSMFNSDENNPFSLASYIDNDLDVSDSFALASKVCERMANGVFLFYGVKDMMSVDIAQSFTRTFHMPYLSPSTAPGADKPGPKFEVHMKPGFAYAIIDMILHYMWENDWRKIHYVYDSDEGLKNMQLTLAKLHEATQNDTVTISVLARRLYNVEHAHDELRQLDRMDLDMTRNKVIVFDLSSEEAYKHILRQIPEVGMNKEGYHYLVATLDFANLEMGRYLHGGVNITGFQLLDFNNPKLTEFLKTWQDLNAATFVGAGTNSITYEAALGVDGIEVITRALTEMINRNSKIFKSTFRRKQVYNFNRTKGVPCTHPPTPWMHGDAIMEHIKALEFEGLTGLVKFNDEGFRLDYKLDVYTVGLDMGPTKIGTWTQREAFQDLNPTEIHHEGNVTDIELNIVTSIISQPFLMYKEPDQSGAPMVGEKKFEGYCVDLAKEVAKINKFDFVIKLVEDGKFGNKENGTEDDPDSGEWNGMVGELVNGVADIAIASLTITYEREKDIDFTKPFMNFGISIMIKKPEIMKPGVFSFMEPLEAKIWIFIVFAYGGVSVVLFLVSRFSPYEWRKSSDGGDSENHFNILNALWFSMGALMLQGSDACPRSFSGRVIGTVWWFFILIIISSYTANLAAFFTIERMHTPIESADDLVMQTDIKYGTLRSGSSKEFFEDSSVDVYKRMWGYMDNNPSVFVDTVREGIDRVKMSKGKYAFLLESPTNEYINNREPCDTMKVAGGNLNSKGFGIATPKGSPLRDQMNLAVLELMEDGSLLKLRTKWWKDKGVCGGQDGKDSSKKELSLSNVAGVFYILVGGLAVAVVLASIEFLCSKTKFMEKTPYIRATNTMTTFVSTPTAEPQNGDVVAEGMGNNRSYDVTTEESTYQYASPPPCIGFEHFTKDQEHTEF